jgi:nucleoporin NUP42
MFRNLARKYSLDPSVFGLSTAPSVAAVGGMSQPGIAGTPLAFGQPTPLGGGSPFGMVLPTAPSFGAIPGAFSQPFGSAGTIGMGSPSFGTLANAPAQASFGSFASPQGAFGASTPFGGSSPFGAPRR